MEHFDILIIGAGAAGISAAREAAKSGKTVAILDRKEAMGGVLLQCAHRGFGEGLTGPEYVRSLLKNFPTSVKFYPNTTVTAVHPDKTAQINGGEVLSFDRLILATGCREIPAGALPIAGTRPRGVYTAGQMQELMNLHGVVPDGPVVILGSGDIGLIMANQIHQLGIPVTLVEKGETVGGMARNRRFLQEANLDIYTNDTVSVLYGHPVLTGVTLDSGKYLPCQTLLIAVGLRPEQELVQHLGEPEWLTLCGNCRQVQPMVEAVIADGIAAGRKGDSQ